MEQMSCPQCQGTMIPHRVGTVEVGRCSSCSGLFLERADLGALSELENDWHRGASGPMTEPLPRITPDMTAPPKPRPRARSFVETLFG